MRILPILFSSSMILQNYAGLKTQTRRVARAVHDGSVRPGDVLVVRRDAKGREIAATRIRPRFRVGDRVYVREAWRTSVDLDPKPPSDLPTDAPVYYEADDLANPDTAGRLRAGMHLPRRLSRCTIVITDVRGQHLHDINNDDAIAEGALGVATYRLVWERINGADSWAANPLVTAYTYEFHPVNVDKL